MKASVKKIAALLLAIAVMIPAVLLGTFAEEPEPTPTYTATPDWGPNADGNFEIATPGDLLAFAAKRTSYSSYSGKKIYLTADIDMNPGWDASGKTEPTNIWTPMFYLYGTLDGQGHTIKGLYSNVDDNACFIVCAAATTIKNLKIENSYFCSKKNAGFISCIRHTSIFSNIYIDAIVESTGASGDGVGGGDVGAGGFAGWYYTSSATTTPKATFSNCVFAGTVISNCYAGGFIGSNMQIPSDKGTGNFDVILTDCANYGTVTSANAAKAAGLIGDLGMSATLTRCYSAGTAAVAIANINQTTAKTVAMTDCYYRADTGVSAMTKSAAATDVTLTYGETAATEIATATVAELVAKDAFKPAEDYAGWTANSDNTVAMPAAVMEIANGHDYEAVVTAPTCAHRGYTTYTCKNCGFSYEGDYVDALPHTEGENWIVDKEATADRAGSRHKECTVCGATLKTEIIPKLASSDATATTAATATEAPVTTEAPTGTQAEVEVAKKSGCSSSIALGGALGILATLSLGVTAIRKKEQ